MKNSILHFFILANTMAKGNGGCVSGDFSIKVKGHCNYTAVLNSFREWYDKPGNIDRSCSNLPENELLELLQTTASGASTVVKELCSTAYENYPKVPFQSSTDSDMRFVEEFYKGNGDWNEQVATLYPSFNGATIGNDRESMLLSRDAKQVSKFYDGDGRHDLVDFPDLPNFQTCDMNAVYCCWPKDRQVDANGNCNQPYDDSCVDADPADNTDVCYVDHSEGSRSTGLPVNDGWFMFPFDDGSNQYSAEGPMHCHGFGWADDTTDPSQVYRGNNLFYVSLYDHMYVRGYVKNIPGAPMCACAEQMPTVSRADCTQIDFENQEHDFIFTFQGDTVTARLSNLFIKFNACQGIDENGNAQNNDLWSYMNRMYIQNKISATKLQALTQKLVGTDNCPFAEARYLSQKNLVRGYENDSDDEWLILRGRDALEHETFYGKEAFNYLVNANSNNPVILRRACASCYFDQQWLYYKRITPIPQDLDLWYQLQYGRSTSPVNGNVYGIDFLIFGNYEDALQNKNAWRCPTYAYSEGFPGNCGPNNSTRNSQGSTFDSPSSRPDVAWHLEKKGRTLSELAQNESQLENMPADSLGLFSGLITTTLGDVKIPGKAYVNDVGSTMFMSASGNMIGGQSDSFRFAYQSTSGDVTMIVKVKSLDPREQSAKTGLMIRESLAVGSKFFGVFINAKLGVTAEYRPTTSGWATASTMVNIVQPFIWFKVTKRMNVFTAFRSLDGVVWTVVGAPQTMNMDDSNLKVGLALTSSYNFKMTEASYEDFESINYFYPSASPTQSLAPSQSIPSLDIGSYDTNYKSEIDVQATKYIIKASGGGVSGSQDGFTFINYEVEGDFDMTAKIISSNFSTSWTKAGLMARDSLDPKSKMIFALFAPQQGTIATIRSQYGGSAVNFQPFYDTRTWIWLRLKREGGSFTAFRSLTGSTLQECSWQLIRQFNAADVTLDTTLQIGMAVTSSDLLKHTTVTFDKFDIKKPSVGSVRALRGTTGHSSYGKQ